MKRFECTILIFDITLLNQSSDFLFFNTLTFSISNMLHYGDIYLEIKVKIPSIEISERW